MRLIERFKKIPEKTDFRYKVIILYSAAIMLSSLLFSSPREILYGTIEIILSPGVLISDYFEIANTGAAFFNGGALMLICILISLVSGSNMNGTMIAAVFTVGGFGLFGKNIINIWPVIFGVFIFTRFRKESFGKYILVAFFGTALSPLVSQMIFGFGFGIYTGIAAGVIAGLFAGFILPALANSFVRFHQGFNLYNIGFTCGIIGTVMISVVRGFGIDVVHTNEVSGGNNFILSVYLFILFSSMLVTGLILNKGLGGYRKLLQRSGRLVSDFVTLDGFEICLINMGILGIIYTLYIILTGGELNGPILGGIFTIVGFAAFGKHLRNALPVLAGVYLASLFKIWDAGETGPLLAALFGTTLAPVSGEFGWKAGIVAGFVHMSVVMHVGYLHGGVNLYNNGFSGGIVAAALVPVLISFRRESDKNVI